MQHLKILIESRNENGGVRGELELNGGHCGTLYMTSTELETFESILRIGCEEIESVDIKYTSDDSTDIKHIVDEDPWGN